MRRAIFQPKGTTSQSADDGGAFDTGDGGDPRTWSRRTLFDFACGLNFHARPRSVAVGHGLGSFSLDLTGVYPGWMPAPHDGEIYPHNLDPRGWL